MQPSRKACAWRSWAFTLRLRTRGPTLSLSSALSLQFGGAPTAFTVYRTHHGPAVRAADGRWVSVALMQKPIEALSQSYLRTKASDLAPFLKIADTYRANSSNNTIFADDKGEIAYLHPQFIPLRDDRFDYTKPVDGADPATDWKGLTPPERAPHAIDPPNGWVMNTNDWPYSAAGPYSPKRADFPHPHNTTNSNMTMKTSVVGSLNAKDRLDEARVQRVNVEADILVS